MTAAAAETVLSVSSPVDEVESPSDKRLTEEEKRDKTRLRQEKNRVAAKRCRERKQQYYQDLERSTEQLKDTNRALLTQIELLNAELNSYKARVEQLQSAMITAGVVLVPGAQAGAQAGAAQNGAAVGVHAGAGGTGRNSTEDHSKKRSRAD